jgi:hypothetical protein
MSARKARIDKLQGQLRPSDLVSLCLGEMEQFDSPAEYLESALGEKESDSVEYQIIHQASSRRKITQNGVLNKSVGAEISHWLKRVLFLRTLRWAANSEVEKIAAHCDSRLEFFRGFDASDRPYEIPILVDDQFFVARVNRIVSEVLTNLRAAELALGAISARGFHGRVILFPSIARAMEQARQDARICAEKLVEIDPDKRARPEQVESAAQAASEVVVRKLFDYAKAVALLKFDERTQALERLKVHLGRD